MRAYPDGPPADATEQEVRDWFQWNLGGKFRVGLKRPRTTGGYDIPAIAGSEADTQNSWRGSTAGM
jgi:hypothetical protein